MTDTREQQSEKIPEVASFEYTISRHNESIQSVTTEFGIRYSQLENFRDSGDVRIGDTFQFTRMADGSGVLTRIRGKIKKPLSVPKEAIYQNIEAGPESFPQIAFLRLPNSNAYRLIGKNNEELGSVPLLVDSMNLDKLKKEIDRVSGVFLTECSARSALAELSCDIKAEKGYKGVIELNSKAWYDALSSVVSLDSIQKLLKGSVKPTDIAEALAHSFNPQKRYTRNTDILAKRP